LNRDIDQRIKSKKPTKMTTRIKIEIRKEEEEERERGRLKKKINV
jgi:hypothetical protein